MLFNGFHRFDHGFVNRRFFLVNVLFKRRNFLHLVLSGNVAHRILVRDNVFEFYDRILDGTIVVDFLDGVVCLFDI